MTHAPLNPILTQLIKEDYDFVYGLGVELFFVSEIQNYEVIPLSNAIELLKEALTNDRLEIKFMALAANFELGGYELTTSEIEQYKNLALEIIKFGPPSARNFAMDIFVGFLNYDSIVGDLKIESLIHLLAILVESDNIYCDVRLDFTTKSNENPQKYNSLIELSTHSSWLVRLSATRELADIDDPRVAEHLEAALNDENACVRSVAIVALANRSNSHDSAYFAPGTFLSKTVRTPFNGPEFRQSVVRLLNGIGGSRVVVPLISFLYDEDADVRASAAEALGELKDDRAVGPLIALLEDEESEIVLAAATALAELGERFHAVGPLIALLKDEESEIVLAAATALAELGERFHAVGPLIALLKDEESEIVLAAATALAELGERFHAVGPLIALLEEKYRFVQISAIEALSEMKEDRAVGPLIALLEDEDEDADVRASAAEALGEMKEDRAVGPLIALLEDEEISVIFSAIEALGELKDDRAIVPLLQIAVSKGQGSVNYVSASDVAILALREFITVDHLIGLSNSANTYSRCLAASGLGKIKIDNAVEPLIALLEDAKDCVLLSSIEALGELKDYRAVEPLIVLLEDEKSEVVLAAATALADLGEGFHAVEPLIVLLEDEKSEVVLAAATALADLGEGFHAVEPLIVLLEDEKSEVVLAAATALADLGEGFHAVEPLIRLNLNPGLDTWARLNAFTEKAVFDKIIPQISVKDCDRFNVGFPDELYFNNFRDDDTIVLNGLLFCTQLIAERASHFARIEMLHNLWAIKYSKRSSIEFWQLNEQLLVLKRSIDSLGEIQPYTYLAAAILSVKEGQLLKAVEWIDKGLSRATDGEILVHVALTILKAEALVNLGRSKEALKVLESIEAVLPVRISVPVISSVLPGMLDVDDYNVEFWFLPKLELLVTKAFVLSNLERHRETIDLGAEAEHLSRIYKLWGWVNDYHEKRLIDGRIAVYLTKAHGVEHERNAKRASDFYSEHKPVGIQETYAFQLNLSLKIEAALESGENENYQEAYKTIERFQLESMPLPSELNFADEDRNSSVREYISIEQEVNDLVHERNYLKGSNRELSNNELKQLDKQLREKKAELERFVIELKIEHPDIAAKWARAPTDFVHLQKRLDPETAILQFLVLNQESYAFLFRNSGSIEIAPLHSESRIVGGKCPEEPDVNVSDCFSLEDSVPRYKSLLRRESKIMPREDKDEMNYLGEKLSKVLLHPFKEAIDEVEHLAIVPNGILHHLPWPVLPWEDGHLVEHKTLTILPATSLFGAVTALSQEIRPSGLLALGDPIINEKGWSKLPSSRHEVENIVAQFPDSLPKIPLLGDDATRDAIIERDLRGYILHFATHAEAATPQRTRLLLTNGDLTYNDILSLNIKNAPVVVLSACRTGIGKLLSGDQVYSLADAFLSAQAQSVVYSLWLVDDASTATLMIAFYESFNQVADSSRALAQAQRTMIEKGFLPKHWAGFVVSRWTD